MLRLGAAFDCGHARPTAVTIAAILQKGEGIKSPGGYLRSLTEKARGGAFSLGPVLMALLRAVAQRMIPRRRGKIINICSVQSELGRPNIAPYTASKGAVKMLTKGMAIDLGPHGITVNGLGPGYFKTELTAKLVADEAFSAWLAKRTPAGRWGDPRELVGAARREERDARPRRGARRRRSHRQAGAGTRRSAAGGAGATYRPWRTADADGGRHEANGLAPRGPGTGRAWAGAAAPAAAASAARTAAPGSPTAATRLRPSHLLKR